MQKWLFAALGLCAGVALSIGAVYSRHWSEVGRYGMVYEGVVQQEAVRCQQFHNAVVFIGDSNTYGLATSNIVPRSENLGVNGDTILHVLYRLGRCDLRGAKAVVLDIGVNDWAADRFDDFRNRYSSLLSTIPVPVIASAIPPVDETKLGKIYSTDGMNAAIRRANEDIEAVCQQRPSCTFIPVPKQFYSPDGSLQNWAQSSEGLHLSPKAYAVWGEAVQRALGVRPH